MCSLFPRYVPCTSLVPNATPHPHICVTSSSLTRRPLTVELNTSCPSRSTSNANPFEDIFFDPLSTGFPTQPDKCTFYWAAPDICLCRKTLVVHKQKNGQRPVSTSQNQVCTPSSRCYTSPGDIVNSVGYEKGVLSSKALCVCVKSPDIPLPSFVTLPTHVQLCALMATLSRIGQEEAVYIL